MSDWRLYAGTGQPHDGIDRLPDPPAWREFRGEPVRRLAEYDSALTVSELHQAKTYKPQLKTIERVNAALYLRRPLLVTGKPGTGKSTLAAAVAYELKLGPALYWPITSRTTQQHGLYTYDPLSRLHASARVKGELTGSGSDEVGEYLTLGPLGAAMLPHERPRVLLIDEIDKSDIDLPNDLLTIFEKGEYEIPELARMGSDNLARVRVAGESNPVEIRGSTVRCNAFPLVILTSNGEREFPPAFLRRCIILELDEPSRTELNAIVREHLRELADGGADVIEQFLARRTRGELATDQLLNAIYFLHHADRAGPLPDREALIDAVMPFLAATTLDGEYDLDQL